MLYSRYLLFILEMPMIHSELVDIRAEITVMGGDEYDVEMTVIAGPFSPWSSSSCSTARARREAHLASRGRER